MFPARGRTLGSLLLMLVLAVPIVLAQSAPAAKGGWVQLPAAGAAEALAFAVIDNPTMYDFYVMSATADVAAKIVFRRAPASPDGKPQVMEQLTVDGYGSLTMKPDGVHMVLTGLTRPLKVGEKVQITLTTDGGLELPLAADVR